MEDLNAKKHLLVGVTGSVATIKLYELLEKLKESIQNLEIKIICTERAKHFIQSIVNSENLDSDYEILSDEDEWTAWSTRNDPVLHIELRKWADVFLIAPLDANTMAKAAYGICDNLLTCVLRAWDIRKPVIVCPAMNTMMWTHPLTAVHLDTLTKLLNYIVIPPVSKTLICGDSGIGAMAHIDNIEAKVKEILEQVS